MLLREFFPGVLPPKDAGPGGNAGKPAGAGKEWKKQGSWPYADPYEDVSEVDEPTERMKMRFAAKTGLVVPRQDMGYRRPDVGTYVGGQAGTFNALAERVGFMSNSIVPLVHFNRMTNRTQDLNDPMQIPNVTYGPGVKNRTGTIYGTSHPSVLAGDSDDSFIPGQGDILPDRDERGLLKAQKRFRDLQSRNYGSFSRHAGRPVIVGERK